MVKTYPKSWVTGSYLLKTSGRWWEQLHAGAMIIYLILIMLLFLVGSLFWVAGSNATSDVTLLPFFIACQLAVGVWTGLAYTSFHRPSELWWLGKSSWFWLQHLRGIGVGVILALASAVPYYLGHLALSNLNIWQGIVVAKVTLGLMMAAALLGGVMSLIIRRLSRIALVRVSLLILGGYLILGAGLLTSNVFQAMDRTLLLGRPETLITLLLTTIALVSIGAILTELLMAKTPLSTKPTPRFWPVNLQHRMFMASHSREVSYYLSQLLFFIRSHYFQRRIIILMVAGILTLSVTLFNELNDQIALALANAISYLAAYFVSQTSGSLCEEDQRRFRLQLVSKRTIFFAGYAAGLTVLMIILLAINQFSALSGQIALISYLTAVLTHTLFFTFSYLSKQAKTRDDLSGEDKTLIGLILAAIVASLPIFFYGHVDTWTLTWILWLWLIGIWFSITRVAARSR